MKVIYTEKSQVLASRVAEKLGCKLGSVKFTTFPDGEQYVRIEDLDDEMVLVASTVDNNTALQVLLLMDACEGRDVTLVLPYMGYARQDKKFNDGEPISARALARALSEGAKRVITVNIHDTSVLNHFRCPAVNLSIASEIGAYIKSQGVENPLILSPDEGAWYFAKGVAEPFGWDCDHLDKTRLSGSEVKMAPKHLDAKGRDCYIVDDIIATGGSMALAASMLMEQGAKSVRAAGVHGVFASGGYIKLMQGGLADVATSDTIERASSKFSAAGIIADAIRK
ncbi:MAG TPA: ribose-phosphate diphosphokinase [Methanocorpusculum sp.]|nr:ribose-phosphate diphosphokinase [Methanocorpusculum sp.]HJJ40404.1 ribose-phosphate diphosphokinase [Methanocorpusculum sp.]HJJ49699.1 ribose-phosphate diphosphokinase [Methanocorpusculum sp.]HJJ57637.1 ribose-phosphate diphosphokinase [Methanocorpusculum sp.]HJJ95063.1 ribose-phosphate diphosphokinase [Methanocorpusculum sp.]